ncbi:MAG: NAD(P)/FAD-dependent oxidoreductase [Clostridia bacterium]|nr:NAD(P)/FAD-dependent oxidoreductase [Clostridia bacterium]
MKVCVVGGGAAGTVASIFLARGGAEVVLVEKNEKIGKKLYITGKGRCNVTNDVEPSEFLKNVVHGEKYLRSAIYGFTPKDTMDFCEGLGVPLVVERGNRVFPLSQKSSDIIRALANEIERLHIDLRLNTEVKEIRRKEDAFEVLTPWEKIVCDKVVVATGGISYASTGSTGDGYKFAKEFGHEIVDTKPALCPLILADNVSALEGISLKNVNLTAYNQSGNIVASEFGEMMFTSRGITGPIVLTISSFVTGIDGVKLSLDLKPALDEKTLDARILRDFDERKNQDLKNVTRALLPERLNLFVLKRAGLSESKKVNEVTKDERKRLVETIKDLKFTVVGTAPFAEAVITSGGISLKNLKPTGESKLSSGLYFVGETVDIDALTGGFNLQLAFATAVCAANDILKSMAKA